MACSDDAVERVLVVTAHPDDVDFGAAGSVATWTDAGIEVAYCIVTDGDAGGHDRSVAAPRDGGDPTRASRRRRPRSSASPSCTSSAIPTVASKPTLDLRRDISRVIREVRPQRVVCPVARAQLRAHLREPPRSSRRGRGHAVRRLPRRPQPVRPPRAARVEGLEPWTVDEVWIMAHRDARPLRRHHRRRSTASSRRCSAT